MYAIPLFPHFYLFCILFHIYNARILNCRQRIDNDDYQGFGLGGTGHIRTSENRVQQQLNRTRPVGYIFYVGNR
jgi:hypothetical protein